MNIAEQWMPVSGYETRYAVSNLGHLKRADKDLIIPGTLYSRGYIVVCLSLNGAVKRRSLHSLVAEHFIGPRPDGMQIDHVNGIRTDNRACNLRYCTARENIRGNVERGATATGSKNGAAKLSEEAVAYIREQKAKGGRYWGAAKIAEELGVWRGCVERAARGTHWKHVEMKP